MDGSGLERSISDKIYSVQFKLDVIQYQLEIDDLYLDVAIKFGIIELSVIANWLRSWQRKEKVGMGSLN